MTMNKPDEFRLMTPKQKRRLIAFFSIYTVLFLIIGPKFALLTVYEKNANGEFVPNRLERFVSGSHEDGIVQLCFEGTLKGDQTQMMYTVDLTTLKESTQKVDGLGEVLFNEQSIELFSRDLTPDCSAIGVANFTFGKLPDGAYSTNGLLKKTSNQRVLITLQKGSYIFFYSLGTKGKIYDKTFVLYLREEQATRFHNFWLRGGLQRESSLGARDYAKAFVKDFLRWPYILILLLSGAGSH